MQGFGKYNLKRMLPKKIRILVILILLLANPWFMGLRQEFSSGLNFESFDTIFRINPEDIQQINTRRSYYPNQIVGKIFENKPGFFLDKYKENFFQGLDLNYYFFANHPRERIGIQEKEKIYWIWLPVFLIGLIWSLKNFILLPGLIFLGTLSLVSFFTKIDNFNLVLMPFFILNIFYGLKRLILK